MQSSLAVSPSFGRESGILSRLFHEFFAPCLNCHYCCYRAETRFSTFARNHAAECYCFETRKEILGIPGPGRSLPFLVRISPGYRGTRRACPCRFTLRSIAHPTSTKRHSTGSANCVIEFRAQP